MKILDIRPAPPGGNTRARFDVEMDGLRLFNLALKRTESGWRVFSPSAFGCSTALFAPDLAARMADAARLACGEMTDNDCSAA